MNSVPPGNARADGGKMAVSLRAKLSLVFCCLFILMTAGALSAWVWGIPFTSYQGNLEHEKQMAARSLNLLADLKKERLLSWLDERRNDFLFLSDNRFLAQGVAQLRRRIAQLRSEGVPAPQLWQAVARDPLYPSLVQFMGQFLAVEGRYVSMEVLDAVRGEVIVATEVGRLGSKPGEETVFQGALRSGGSFVSDAHPHEGGTAPLMAFGRAILVDGEPLAVIIGHVNAEAILKPLLGSEERGLEFSEAVLVNNRSVTLTSLRHPLPDGSTAQPLSSVISAAPASLAASGEEGFVEARDYRNVPVFAAYRHVRLSSSVGWGLVVKRDTKEVLGPIYQSLMHTAVIWAAGLLLALLGTLFLARTLVRPLRQLSEVSRKVAAGDMEVTAAVLSRDEVGQLAEVFNDMLGRLRALTHGLEAQVASRTAELVDANQQLRREMAERLAAQEARLKSEQDYRRIVDTANEGICIIDSSLRVTFVNGKMAEMLGHAPAEMVGKEMVNFVHTSDTAAFYAGVERRKKGWRETYESRYLRSDGEVIWALVNATPLQDHQGDFLGAFTMLTDITDRKRDEEALKKSEARLRLALEAAQAGAWESDLATGDNYWSEELWDLYGLKPHGCKPSNQAWLESVHPDDREQVERDVAAAVSQGGEFNSRWRVSAPGALRWLMSRGRPYRNDQGQVVGYLGIAMDITSSKLAEQALAEEKERLMVTLRSIGDGVITTDTEARIVLMNKVAEDLTSWSQSAAVGRPIGDVFHIVNEQTRQVCDNPVEKVLSAGTVVGLANHTVLVARDGTNRAIADSGAPILSAEGRVLGVVLVFRDVSQKRMVENELRQAQKMEAIGTLAGGIAHDFNNILAAVLGFAEIALEDAKNGRVNPGDLEQILSSAQRAKALVQHILAFSRKKDPDLKPLDINQVILRTRNVLQRTIPKMVEIQVDLDRDLPPVMADAVQLEQVLFNLAGNATDAMPDGGRMFISTRPAELDQEYCSRHPEIQPGRYSMIEVADTGAGMDRETLEHIFDPFFTTKGVGKGTGLGLSSVYGIVKSHGGHVHCYSEVGLGSSFKVYFPVIDVATPAVDEEGDKVGDEFLKGSETILLVDDEEKLLGIGSRALESRGYRVLTAHSGEEALEIFSGQSRTVDLVVMDLGMPGMGGHKALKAILALNPSAKVVIASGYAAGDQVKTSLESGAAGYVAKPYKRVELLTAVRAALDRK